MAFTGATVSDGPSGPLSLSLSLSLSLRSVR
ncbi:MAG: hypothetical protein QOI20_206 [Acidimicrobiaceae bacterium]|nr:hypothetical protein [Acidimicrobiaceae bacterium]